MDVTELGMVTEDIPLQFWKAPLPMDVTELGMVTEVRPLQPEKASYPMDVTELGMTNSFTSLPFRYKCFAEDNGFEALPANLILHHAPKSVI